MVKDGSLSARSGAGGSSARRGNALNGAQMGASSANFLKLVERSTDAFVQRGDDSALEDVKRILLDVRQKYDQVHSEAEKKEIRLREVKEANRLADVCHGQRIEETLQLRESGEGLDRQLQEALSKIKETETSRKVYSHMLARMQKEQAILKQKMLRMEEHMARKKREIALKVQDTQRMELEKTVNQQELDKLERDAESERGMCKNAKEVMDGELERRQEANKRRADFESWRQEVALEAANDAFNASAGKLRKLYAIEKLAGNSLQKITFEQVERSQNTEDGFQKIREVTGLADVMDIVHKFLNREVEYEQLQGSVKDSEVKKEALEQTFEELKQRTEGMTFDPNAAHRSGELYKDVEEHQGRLNDSLKEHEMCRMRLSKVTLQVEHMKRWTTRVGLLLSSFDESLKRPVENPGELPEFFRRLRTAIEKFVSHVAQQINEGKVQRKALAQVQTREYEEQKKQLASEQFLHQNCRVPATADGRPASRQGSTEDDPHAWVSDERWRLKVDSNTRVAKVTKILAEQQKRQKK